MLYQAEEKESQFQIQSLFSLISTDFSGFIFIQGQYRTAIPSSSTLRSVFQKKIIIVAKFGKGNKVENSQQKRLHFQCSAPKTCFWSMVVSIPY